MTIFFLGTGIIAVFCIALMFYTNSFLIKRRKRNSAFTVYWAWKSGTLRWFCFLKRCSPQLRVWRWGLCSAYYSQSCCSWRCCICWISQRRWRSPVSVPSLVTTVVLFACIYGATLLYNMVHIRLANPVELLHGGQKGEKEPKTSWLLTFAGLAALAGGYFIAVYFKSPLNALLLFFVAVFLVILGTFCLFTAGSIALLKALRRRRNFYYRPNNFIAVSGMMYRMKQNAAALRPSASFLRWCSSRSLLP